MEKVSKRAVNYREAEGRQRCGNCGMFQPPKGGVGRGGCDLVLGAIYAPDTCDEWTRKVAKNAR